MKYDCNTTFNLRFTSLITTDAIGVVNDFLGQSPKEPDTVPFIFINSIKVINGSFKECYLLSKL